MTVKILVATDGSESAHLAQDDLIRSGLPDQLDVIVLSVADVWLNPEGQSDDKFPEEWHQASRRAKLQAEAAVQNSYEIADKDANRMRKQYPLWNITAESMAASPGWGIITRAEQWGADLIVVGSHGVSGLGKLILGSVSQMVLIHATSPVRIGRTTASSDRSGVRLILGMDGSPAARATLDYVLARRWPQGSEIQIVAAIDPRISTAAISDIPDISGMVHDKDSDESTWIRTTVENQLEKIRYSRLQISSHVQHGDPKIILIEQARLWKADCIFLGARGLSRIERFFLGSVSAAVSARANCSVEVIRRKKAQPS